MKTNLKYMILVVLMVFAGLNVSCTPRNEQRSSIKKLLLNENIRTFTIPGFIARYAMLATNETRELRPALRGVRKFTISIADNLNDSKNVFTRISKGLNKSSYNTIVEIIESESRLLVKVLENEGEIKDIVIIINDCDSFVCLSMQGRMNPEDLNQFIASLANNKGEIVS